MSNIKGKGVIIQLNCHIPSTNVAAIPKKYSNKLSIEDRKVVVAQASRVLPKHFFNELHNLINTAVSELQKFAVKMGRGRNFFVPMAKVTEAAEICESFESNFKALRAHLLAGYEQTVAEHAATLEDESLKGFVLKHARTLEYITERISASWLPIPVSIDDLPETLAAKWEKSGESLTHQLYREIAEECADSLKNLVGKDRVGMRTNEKLMRIQEKVEGLAFLDSSLAPLAQSISAFLKGLPAEGMLEGKQALGYIELIAILSDPVKAKMYAEALGTIKAPVSQPTLIPMPTQKLATPTQVPASPIVAEEDIEELEPARRFGNINI